MMRNAAWLPHAGRCPIVGLGSVPQYDSATEHWYVQRAGRLLSMPMQRHEVRSVGLGQTPTERANQAFVNAQIVFLQLSAIWNLIQANIQPSQSQCAYTLDPSFVPVLEAVSVQTCQVARLSVIAALGYSGLCGGAATQHWINAQNLTQPRPMTQQPTGYLVGPCSTSADLAAGLMGHPGDAFGTVTEYSSNSGNYFSCLDPFYLNKVAQQYQMAAQAFAEAQAARGYCASLPNSAGGPAQPGTPTGTPAQPGLPTPYPTAPRPPMVPLPLPVGTFPGTPPSPAPPAGTGPGSTPLSCPPGYQLSGGRCVPVPIYRPFPIPFR